MANTDGHQALKQLIPELEIAIQDDLILLSGRLCSKGFISEATHDLLRNDSREKVSRTAELVSIVLNKVKLNPGNLSVFLGILKDSGDHYSDLINLIESEMPTLSNNNGQSLPDSNIHPITKDCHPRVEGLRQTGRRNLIQNVLNDCKSQLSSLAKKAKYKHVSLMAGIVFVIFVVLYMP